MDDETIAKFVQNLRGVLIGRDNEPPIANRGGGHNGPGLASKDDGLVIDLSIKGVRVDPATATVWVGGGVLSGDADHAMRAFG
jgi:FAD/FMN-containing dehydrogenase